MPLVSSEGLETYSLASFLKAWGSPSDIRDKTTATSYLDSRNSDRTTWVKLQEQRVLTKVLRMRPRSPSSFLVHVPMLVGTYRERRFGSKPDECPNGIFFLKEKSC